MTKNNNRSPGSGPRRGHPRRRSRRGLSRLAAEFGFIASQRGVKAELLAGTPATIALRRGGQLVGLLVVSDQQQAQKMLGLPRHPHRDRHADRLWEIDRRAPSLMEVSDAN